MKAVRYALWGLVAVAAVLLAWQTARLVLATPAERQQQVADISGIGGAFEAQLASATDGVAPITQDALKGRPHLMFFGFTHCPDVCPTTLFEVGQWLDAMGADAQKLDAYFVTVDPARDTAAVMTDYLRPFDRRIKAITGTAEQIETLRRNWRVVAEKVPLDDGGYNVNHTASVYLMKPDGTFHGTIAYGEDADSAVAKLKRLVALSKPTT